MEKVLDTKGRWRNKTVSFRASEEEIELLDKCIALSGLPKQDYIMKRLQCHDIVVQGNSRVYKALRTQLEEVRQELSRLTSAAEVSDELLLIMRLIAEIIKGLASD